MSDNGKKLGRKQEALIAALLTEPTHAAAAVKAGVSVATLHRWLQDPGFLAAYRAARRQLVEGTLGRLQQLTGEAADTLRRNLTCGTPANEIRAAVAVLDHAVQAVELTDLAQQVEELQRRVEELQNGSCNIIPQGGSDEGSPAAGAATEPAADAG